MASDDPARREGPALQGVLLPVTTPFSGDDGRPDLEAFRDNLRAWLSAGVSGVVVAGSTGEAPLLEDRELFVLADAAREVVPEDRDLVVGTGAESTRRTVALSREVAARGADAVMVRPPAYYADAMSHRALKRHYLRVADASPVPVVLYHIPRYVPVGLEPELVRGLARHGNVAGIKDSSGELRRVGEIARGVEGEASVLVGSGTILYGGLEVGATGGVVAVGCMAAEECCQLAEAVASGEGERAGALQERVGSLHRAVVGRHGVAGVKYALDRLGLAGGPPRPPLLPLEEAGRRAVDGALQAARLSRAGSAADPRTGADAGTEADAGSDAASEDVERGR